MAKADVREFKSVDRLNIVRRAIPFVCARV